MSGAGGTTGAAGVTGTGGGGRGGAGGDGAGASGGGGGDGGPRDASPDNRSEVPTPSTDSGGCGCAIGEQRSAVPASAGALLFVLLLLRSRKARGARRARTRAEFAASAAPR